MRVLLTLGRLPKALELARALWRGGARVTIAEPFATHLCKPSRAVARAIKVTPPALDQAGYIRDLEEAIRTENIDLVVPVSEEALHASLLAPRLPPGVRLFGPDHHALARLHDKCAFIETARRHGLSTPETFASNVTEAEAFAAHADYVLKPVHSCSGQGLRLRRAGEPLSPVDRAPGQILQRRIYGRHISSQSLALKGETLGTALYEGAILSGTVAVAFRRIEAHPALEEWIARFVAAEAYSGFIAFDFIEDERGVWPLECNPRLTSGLHFFEPADIAAALLEAAPTRLRFKPQRDFVEWHTAMLETYGALPDLGEFWRRLTVVRRAKDVLLDWSDPWPFFLMTASSWPVLRQVLTQGRSFGEAATADILWRASAQVQTASSEIKGGAHAP
ncbi:MAG: ATP-grasp domain-containing protein [Alphaproteobacteria bacterium]|jgi:predicted ATP-grasp superfamily ATP-dependent carboligase|nr:ATP-grasp domain-containing protein [Alphaproteobacteria bacterium]